MSVIIRNQAIIHYEALGRGRPVVFLHGWVGSWLYWVSSMQAAATSHRSYALDFYGYGDTAHDARLYAPVSQAELVAGFMDDMGIGKAVLVGHGLGAWVAFSVAGLQPERVARIVAVSMPVRVSAMRDRLRTADPAELAQWLSGGRPESVTLLSESSKMDPSAVADSVRDAALDRVFAKFRGAGVPSLLVYGRDDPLFPMPTPADVAELGAGIYRVDLEDSGHFPMLDAADRFQRVLTDFLALEPGLGLDEMQLREEWRRRVR